MAQQESPNHDDLETGIDLPNADGQVSDEDVSAIDGPDGRLKGGKDHSLDNYGETFPDHGVGGVQNSHDPTSDIANIKE